MANNVAQLSTEAALIERVVIGGDLSKLTPQDRTRYYIAYCRSVGLNPMTQPLAYLRLSGKEVLYAKREAADQLRKINGISLDVTARERIDDLYCVTVKATDKTGRTDSDIGAVSIAGLKGEALANAMLKAVTKGKRRVTLSISGLGLLDETEVETIPGARTIEPDRITDEPAPDPRTSNEIYDPESGEVRSDGDRILEAARSAAGAGDAALKRYWRDVPEQTRIFLKEYGAELRDLADKADAERGAQT